MVQVPEQIRLERTSTRPRRALYTPHEDGEYSGYYLRATAKYKDKQSPSGADNDKTASMVSANKVLTLRTTNKAPEFAAVQDPDGNGEAAMAIAKRTVRETAAAGQLVGDPVTAEDDNADDVLTYTLVDDDDDDQFRYRPGHGSDQRGQDREVQRHDR